VFFAPRHWRIQLISGGVILLGGLVLVALLRPQLPDDAWPNEQQQIPVPTALEGLLLQTFDENRCVTAREADDALSSGLTKAGLQGWSLEWDVGVTPDRCVGYAVAAADESITLMRVMSPKLHARLEVLREDLLGGCFSKEQATQRLESVLEQSGETDFEIRTDGPVAAAPERFNEVMRHVEAGCFVYSTTGGTGDGTALYFLAGTP
jgi:hypothetical protein